MTIGRLPSATVAISIGLFARVVTNALGSFISALPMAESQAPALAPLSVMHRRQRGRIEMRDSARVLEGADAFNALLPTDARRLHPAERRTEIEAGRTMVVDPHVTTDHL